MEFLSWLFIIILCTQALPSLTLETLSTTRDRGSVLSKPHLQEHEANEVLVFKQPKVYLRTGQKGTGVYGGANIEHHLRPSEKSAASVPERSLFFIMYAGFSWILLFPF